MKLVDIKRFPFLVSNRIRCEFLKIYFKRGKGVFSHDVVSVISEIHVLALGYTKIRI